MGLLFDHFVSYWVTAGSHVGNKIRWKLYRRGRGGKRVSYFGVAVSDDGKEQSERMSKSRWRQGTMERRSAGYKRAAIANKISVTGIISIIAWWAWKCRRDDNDWLVNHSYVIHIGETNLLSAPPPAIHSRRTSRLPPVGVSPLHRACTSTTYVLAVSHPHLPVSPRYAFHGALSRYHPLTFTVLLLSLDQGMPNLLKHNNLAITSAELKFYNAN